MIHERTEKLAPLPIADYQNAIARAVDWLGDRYLLATPVKAPRKFRPSAPKPQAAGVARN